MASFIYDVVKELGMGVAKFWLILRIVARGFCRERERQRKRQTGCFWPKPDGCWCAGMGGKVKTSFHWLYEWQRFMVCIIIFNSLSPFPPSFINFVTFFPIFLLPYLPVVGLKTLLSKIVCFPAFQNPQELTSNQASSDVFAVSVWNYSPWSWRVGSSLTSSQILFSKDAFIFRNWLCRIDTKSLFCVKWHAEGWNFVHKHIFLWGRVNFHPYFILIRS